ncbi:MAG: hypothetical protein EA001_07335 [Oscillatoriales cyanobacterium]|nr:MAG: hypothetical protein EA001_07335 [Oscillatoriales cyanobacterium]
MHDGDRSDHSRPHRHASDPAWAIGRSFNDFYELRLDELGGVLAMGQGWIAGLRGLINSD